MGSRVRINIATAALAAIALRPSIVCAQTAPDAAGMVVSKHGVVISSSSIASDVGASILRRGGNAVDAAVGTAFALAVTYPGAGNIGGGGFMLVYPGDNRGPAVIEYRETAPEAAFRTMFTSKDGWLGHKVVGVPGTVRGLALAHE